LGGGGGDGTTADPFGLTVNLLDNFCIVLVTLPLSALKTTPNKSKHDKLLTIISMYHTYGIIQL